MSKAKMIMPGETIGILGGGQLGRMMALAGRNLGYRFITLDPTKDAPCAQVADGQIVAPYTDMTAAKQLAEQTSVITYEFENVDAEVASQLEAGAYVPQGSHLLYTIQHRIREKRAIEAAGVQVAPYAEVNSFEDLIEGLESLGVPAVLKTTTGGYDGKGQRVIYHLDEARAAFDDLRTQGELVLEQFISFSCEISVIAARNPDGETVVYPVAENEHIDNILHMSIVPARISKELVKKAEDIALRIADALEVVGIIAVEMFVTEAGDIYVNELAPRPHNSGHYTQDACLTSQFEQHVRAICNLPLTSAQLTSPCVMVNLLGEHMESFYNWLHAKQELQLPDGLTVKIHLYGKEEAKIKRKMGHVNILAPKIEQALAWIESVNIWTTIEEDVTC